MIHLLIILNLLNFMWKADLKSSLGFHTQPGVNIGKSWVSFPSYLDASWTAKKMEVQQWWRMRFSFRNATIFVCFFNVVTAIFLIQGFLASAYNRNKLSTANSNSGWFSSLFLSIEFGFLWTDHSVALKFRKHLSYRLKRIFLLICCYNFGSWWIRTFFSFLLYWVGWGLSCFNLVVRYFCI